MKNKILTTLCLALALITVCYAADITGKWTGKVNGEYDVTFDFKTEGEKLTGNFISPNGESIAITEGLIKDEELSFIMPIRESPIKFKGKIKDEVITLSFDFDGNPMTVDIKKTPAK